jgi:hypothetical protein
MVVRTGAGNDNCPEFAGAGNCPEFAKAVVIIRKSKKDRQHNGWMSLVKQELTASLVKQELPTLLGHMNTTPVFNGVRVAPFLFSV